MTDEREPKDRNSPDAQDPEDQTSSGAKKQPGHSHRHQTEPPKTPLALEAGDFSTPGAQSEVAAENALNANHTDLIHLAGAQRWYLYRIHRASGRIGWLLCAALPVLLIISIWRAPSTNGLFFSAWTAAVAALCVTGWVSLATACWRLVTGDPQHRISNRLLGLAYSIIVIGAVGCVVIAWLAFKLLGASSLRAAPGTSVGHAVIRTGQHWPVVLLAICTLAVLAVSSSRIESLIGRSLGRRGRVVGLITLICLVHGFVGLGAWLLLDGARASSLSSTVGAILGLIGAVLLGLGIMIAAIRAFTLRSAVGTLIRQSEQSEPGPAFEPVSGP